jgi:hypothetical protein
MTPQQKSKAQRIIERQLEMSGATLDALRRAGLTDHMEVQLEFFFAARNEASGQALVAHLAKNDCLDLKLEKSGGFLSRRFSVVGKTHGTVVTPQVLAQWISWMVVQGVTHDCEFDGWGAEAKHTSSCSRP